MVTNRPSPANRPSFGSPRQASAAEYSDTRPEAFREVDCTLNENAANPSPEEFQEIVDFFKQARRGLTEDSAAAGVV